LERFHIGASPLLNQSGVGRDFDEALGKELVALSREFDETPGFGFYDDSAGHNALASDVTRVEGTSGTIAFGSGLLQGLLTKSDGDIAIVAVCAHEFGHIHQYQFEVDRELGRDNLPGFATELHADFLAGWYLSRFLERRPSTSLQTVGDHWNSDEMGSTDFSDPGTHGTSRQRVDAIEAGFYFEQESGLDVAEASHNGILYLRRELA
jgi:hypothetical protein